MTRDRDLLNRLNELGAARPLVLIVENTDAGVREFVARLLTAETPDRVPALVPERSAAWETLTPDEVIADMRAVFERVTAAVNKAVLGVDPAHLPPPPTFERAVLDQLPPPVAFGLTQPVPEPPKYREYLASLPGNRKRRPR